MKFGTEAKIGLTGVLTIIIIIWGVNYLKGVNILSSNYSLIAKYQEIDGLQPDADVMLKGFKIGTVKEIKFENEDNVPFTLSLELEKKYKIPKGSVAEIYSSDLLGSKGIRIIQTNGSSYLQSEDTILTHISPDMISALFSDLTPLTQSINAAVKTLDSVGKSVNNLLTDPSAKKILSNLESTSGKLNENLSESGDLGKSLANLRNITQTISDQNTNIKNTLENLDHISSDIQKSNLDSLINYLAGTSNNLNEITNTIKSGSGTVGKLLLEDSLYNQLNMLIINLDSLIRDVNNNPKKYLSFSLIGK